MEGSKSIELCVMDPRSARYYSFPSFNSRYSRNITNNRPRYVCYLFYDTDIRGAGASCIYPLLACTLRPWTMYGTGLDPLSWNEINVLDIDKKSIQYAIKNVAMNNLQSRIQILTTIKEGPLLPLNLFQIDRYTTIKVM
jgi:RNA methyltransferase